MLGNLAQTKFKEAASGRLRLIKVLIFLAALLLTMAISYLRHVTGPEYALTAFYLMPIVLSAWLVGLSAGVCISLTSALSWLTADLSMAALFSNPFVPYVNQSLRFLVFLFITLMITKMKKMLEIQERLARTDPLTGISNRLAFFEYAEIEVNKAKRYGYPISILSLDVDNFKAVNDQFGHREGDNLLRVVAGTIRANIRIIDIAARFGGDEFVILLSRTNSDDAYQLGIKLQRKLSTLMRQNNWAASVSIGVATYDYMSENIHDMVASADALMYSAKQNGKNMVLLKVIARNERSMIIH